MSGQTIFKATQRTVTGVYYLAILLGCIAIGVSTFGLITGESELTPGKGGSSISFEVMDFGSQDSVVPYRYSPGNKAALQPVPHKYQLLVPQQTSLGFVHYLISLLQLGASLYIIWSLKKILDNISLKEPFTAKSATYIQTIGLALIFIDLVKIVQYILFNSLANDYFASSRLELVTNVGGNIWLGMIIIALAVVYRRGVEIYSENQLTI
ncbi:MAG: DUF2975 domain-containing protein [Agriterribacter sp.]